MSDSEKWEPLTANKIQKGQIVRALVHGHPEIERNSGYRNHPLYTKVGDVGEVVTATTINGYARLRLLGEVNEKYFHLSDRPIDTYQYRSPGNVTPLVELMPDAEVKKWKEKQAEFLKTKELMLLGKMAGFYTGTDPEFFALNEKGKVIPAFEFLPSVLDRENNGPFWDGFQAEINPEPKECLQRLQASTRAHISKLYTALLEHNPKARLFTKSVVEVDKEQLIALPDEFVALGCSPSQSVYADEQPLEVSDPRSLLYRSAGCHIHFGIRGLSSKAVVQAVKAMDAIAAVAMVSLFQGMEDPRRRLLYGKAGEYRLPAHGIEYRTPPAEVMCHPAIFHLCFDLTRQAFGVGREGKLYHWKAEEDTVRKVVNECDVKGARKILKANKDALRQLMSSVYPSNPKVLNNFETLVFTGARNWIEVNALGANWGLESSGAVGVMHNYEMSIFAPQKQKGSSLGRRGASA